MVSNYINMSLQTNDSSKIDHFKIHPIQIDLNFEDSILFWFFHDGIGGPES